MKKRARRKWPKPDPKDRGLHRVLVDFDGTLAEDTWPSPKLGDPIKEGLEILRHFAAEGFQCDIFTARPEEHRNAIRLWLKVNGVYDLVYDIICNKPAGWLIIDDRAWNPWRN